MSTYIKGFASASCRRMALWSYLVGRRGHPGACGRLGCRLRALTSNTAKTLTQTRKTAWTCVPTLDLRFLDWCICDMILQ